MSQTLWESSGATIASVTSGSHQWFNTSNAFTTDATNVPATAWLPIQIPVHDNINFVTLQWRGKVVSVAATNTCTALTGRVACVGVCEENPSVSYLAQPAVTRATVATATAQAMAAGIALPVFTKSPNAGGASAYSIMEWSAFNAGFPDCWPLIPDSTNVAAEDYTEGTMIIGQAPISQNSLASVNSIPLSVRNIRKAYIAIKFIPTLGGALTDLVIAGKLAAYFS